jgi:DNA-directed RNA polymerase specialized sigma24 family protein
MATVPLGSSPPVARWDDALVQLYERHYDHLVRLAYLVSGQAGQAEELVQDAFVRTPPGLGEGRDPLPYLRTTVVNGCRSLGRRQQLERERRPRAPEPVSLGADELWGALATLSDRQRGAPLSRSRRPTSTTGCPSGPTASGSTTGARPRAPFPAAAPSW